jgi:hypothetical protein
MKFDTIAAMRIAKSTPTQPELRSDFNRQAFQRLYAPDMRDDSGLLAEPKALTH